MAEQEIQALGETSILCSGKMLVLVAGFLFSFAPISSPAQLECLSALCRMRYLPCSARGTVRCLTALCRTVAVLRPALLHVAGYCPSGLEPW